MESNDRRLLDGLRQSAFSFSSSCFDGTCRIVIWFVFLLRISRLDLNLLRTHSDRVAGIGFLNKCTVLFQLRSNGAGSTSLGLYCGSSDALSGDPRAYKLEAAGVLIIVLASVLAPLH